MRESRKTIGDIFSEVWYYSKVLVVERLQMDALYFSNEQKGKNLEFYRKKHMFEFAKSMRKKIRNAKLFVNHISMQNRMNDDETIKSQEVITFLGSL